MQGRRRWLAPLHMAKKVKFETDQKRATHRVAPAFKGHTSMAENKHVTSTREDSYRLLATCYYPPTAAFIQEGCVAALADLLESIIPEAGRYAREASRIIGEDLESLAVEHARLFIGPFHLAAPPYGSIYLDDAKTVMGDSTAKVAAFYHSCGLHLADDFHELPDHFAVELEFMSFLAFKQREAEVFGNVEEVARIVSLQREFLERFLLPWLAPFTSAIITDGEAPFYQAIAHCTAAFINADYTALTCPING
jgi:TorA maturation chaperone TorD